LGPANIPNHLSGGCGFGWTGMGAGLCIVFCCAWRPDAGINKNEKKITLFITQCFQETSTR
jgi:hypothetical protein